MIHVYHLGKDYRTGEIWSGDADGQRKCLQSCRPKTCQSHRARYDIMCEFLRRNEITPPPYKPRKTPEPYDRPGH
jgi:hypothetical protein